MRCKICDYRLWNLKSRVCPECGTPFKPSDFEFFLNSVQFCCPHCNQAYYGTGDKGHLVPAEFDCVKCARHVHLDEMVLLPTEGIEEEQTKADTMPWMEREKRGAVRAWFSTVRMALISPGRLMNNVPIDSSVGSAVWFAVFSNAIIFFPSLLAVMIVPLIMALVMTSAMAPTGGQTGGPPPVLGMLAGIGGMMFGIYVALTVCMILSGALAHGLLKLTGKTARTIGRTYHAICYSSCANVITAIPCMGVYFGWIWWLISAIIMLKHGQKVHGGRATLAVGFTPFVLIVGFIGLTFWGLSAARSTAFGSTSQIVCQSLLDYAADNNGKAPDHAIQLVADDYLAWLNLSSMWSATGRGSIPIGDTTLDKFATLEAGARDEIVQAEIEALPAGVIAHRLGDFVFTYHGIDLSSPDPALWLVIMSPDPDVNRTGTATVRTSVSQGGIVTASTVSGGLLAAGLADGTPMFIQPGGLAQALQAQNTLRAKYNLSPLPDPATVTHAKPAVATKTAPGERSAGD